MPITDPFDKTKTYPTVRDLVKKYTPSVPSELLAIMIDEIRADRDGPEANIEITGGMTPVTVPHGLKDEFGTKLKPNTWHITGFRGVDKCEVVSIDDTNITVDVTNKGVVKLRVFG